MDTDARAGLDALLEGLGRFTFEQGATVGGAPARITMSDRELFVAVTSDPATVLHAPFDRVELDAMPDEPTTVDLRVADVTLTVALTDRRSADRLIRVFDVRRDPGRPLPSATYDPPLPPAAMPPLRGATAAHRYRSWWDATDLASIAALLVGTLSALAGIVAAAVLLVDGRGAAAGLFLLSGLLGAVMPICLGCLARMLLFRWRMEDERQHQQSG